MAPTDSNHKVLHCRWNWCPRTFEIPTELLSHLNDEHFPHILRVDKSELDIYLRCNEGRSGMTDSLLHAIPTQSTAISQDEESQRSTAPQLGAQEGHPQSPRTSPMRDTAPRNRRTPARSSSGQEGHSPRPGISTHPSPTRDTASQDSRTGLANVPPPVETTHAPSVSRPHTHSRSFADCDAASSPITTPQASPLPPTPPLHARIADAINAAAAARAPPLPLPRRVPPRLPISPAPCGHSPFSQRQASLPVTPLPLPRRAGRSAPQPPFGHTHARAGVANVSADSAASARDVETQLTQYVASATPSPAAPHVPMNVDAAEACARVPSLSYPDDPYPPLRTQAVDDSQDSRADAPHEGIQSPASQASFTMQFSSGRLALRLDSEPPEGDAMDVDFSAPLQLQTQAPYPSQ
ncbi:hypothetical protein C8Q72DRAFT_882170 [Fomitopsis betulina]|nr:hypothetical protein C8Q72DRAFT_882170 [Fomitopsis betulina]